MTIKNKLPEIERYLESAKGIAWDTCHKIYIMADDEQVTKMKGYGYGDENDPESLITSEQMSPDEMLMEIIDWWDRSCGLRFISGVSSPKDCDNDGFKTLVPQFFGYDDEDEGGEDK